MLVWGQGGGFAQAPASAGTASPVVRSAPAAVVLGVEGTGLEELPVASRSWESLVVLSSEAAPAAMSEAADGNAGDAAQSDSGTDDGGQRGVGGGGGQETASGVSAGGVPATQGSATLDGLSAEQSFRAGARGAAGSGPSAGSSFALGAVRSFRLQGTGFSAEQFSVQQTGSGGGLAVVSQQAGRVAHGSAFVQLRSSALAAANPFSVETHYRNGVVTSAGIKPAGSLVQFGGTLGAPLSELLRRQGVKRLREVGVFAAVEASVREDHLVSTPAVASFFVLSAEQRALLGTRGVSAAATNAALNYLDSLTGVTVRRAVRVQSFVRVDAAPGARDRVGVGYVGSRYSAPAGAALGQASDAVVARGRGSLGDVTVQVDAVTGRWLHGFGPRLHNELRGQVAHDLEYETARAPLPQEPAIGPGGLAPQVSIGPNGFAFGTPAELAYNGAGRSAYPEEQRTQLADTVQWRVGAHLLSLGADWSRVHDRIASLRNVEGSFNYDSGTTGGHDGGLVDWITDATFSVNAYPNGGCPSITAAVHDFCFRSYTQSFGSGGGSGLETTFVTHDLAGFVEDAVRPRKGLSVSFGLRYDYTLLPVPQQPNAALDAGIAALGTAGAGAVHGATNVFPEDRNNFGPRASVAWSPRWGDRGRGLTVEAGYGVFYGRIPGATVRAALVDNALPSGALQIRITPATVTQCPQVTGVSQGFGYPCAFTATPPAAVAQTSSTVVFGSRYRVPMVQRGRLAVEQALGSRAMVRASYSVALANELPATTDINIAPSTAMASYVLQGGTGRAGLRDGETFAVPLYTRRLLTGYGPVTALVSNANATYHAGTVAARWAASAHGAERLAVRGEYTFSKAIDYGPQGSAFPSEDTQFDPVRDGYDKGRSAQDFPQRFAVDVTWSPKVHGTGRRLLDGWRVAAIAVAGSGAPYSYRIFGGTRLTGGRESVNGSGGATYLPTIGRDTLRLPMRARVDLRVSREFRLGGTARMQVSASAFNLLNTVNVASVQTRAFLLGTPAGSGAATPLVFQDAAAVAAEGLTNTLPFGAPTSSTTGLSRERQVEVGVHVRF